MTGGTPASALYVGTVRHRRFAVPPHAFSYPVFQAWLDLDEVPALARTVRWFSHNRFGFASLRDRDHLGTADRPVREKLARVVERHGARLPGGPVRLLTNLRTFGYLFNPVSFFYCHAPDGRLGLVVAEVNNTFGETHCYVLDRLEPAGRAVRAWADKVFHVSPFLGMQARYRFTLGLGADTLVVHIDDEGPEGKLLDATLTLRRRPFTSRELGRALLRYPLMPMQVTALIHFEALRLWRKRARFHRKPAPPPRLLEDAE